MATSGTIKAAIRTGYAIQIAWSVTEQSVANNTSTVTANVQLVSEGASYTINATASKSGTLTINGTAYSFTFSAALAGNQTKTIFTKSVTIPHNADGNKTCAFSCAAGINVTLSGTYYGTVNASGSGVFNTIARASTISSVTENVAVNGTNACTVNITRAASTFTHTVQFKIGSYEYTASGVGTSTSYAIPLGWLNAIPNATSGTATVTVTTYSGSTKIGNAVSKNFTITAPTTIVPSISTITISEAVSGLNAQFGGYVQNKSKLRVVTASAGTYSSTIKTVKVEVDGSAYTGADVTTGIIKASGTVAVKATVTDSRGRTATKTQNITVLAYAAPTISALSIIRASSNGTENYEGTYGKITAAFSVASVNSKNKNAYKLEYRIQNGTTWTALESGNTFAYSKTFTTGAVFGADAAFELRLSVTDYFGTITKSVELPTAFTLVDFHSGGRGLALGKVSELAAGLEVNLLTELMKDVYMGGNKKSDYEKNILFQTKADAQNVHNCKIYGGNAASTVAIGMYDFVHDHALWRYYDSSDILEIDPRTRLTKNGQEFVHSAAATHDAYTGRVQFSNGLLLQWGRISIKPVANTPTAAHVNFPVAYTNEPFVSVSAGTGVIGTQVLGYACTNITTSGFDAYLTRNNTVETTVAWLAVGYKS